MPRNAQGWMGWTISAGAILRMQHTQEGSRKMKSKPAVQLLLSPPHQLMVITISDSSLPHFPITCTEALKENSFRETTEKHRKAGTCSVSVPDPDIYCQCLTTITVQETQSENN